MRESAVLSRLPRIVVQLPSFSLRPHGSRIIRSGIEAAPPPPPSVEAIHDLKAAGADCAILGCTEIPLVIDPDNSPLPVLDSTRLLAAYAVREAVAEAPSTADRGWIAVSRRPSAV